jgi:hypothetical protein
MSARDFFARLPGDAAATGAQPPAHPQLAAGTVGAVHGALDPAPVARSALGARRAAVPG